MRSAEVIRKIELCPTCEGRGYSVHRELVDYHKRDYKVWNSLCPRCKGSGRLWIDTVVTEAAYEMPEGVV